ncbi:MAG: hypothetical protein HYT73_04105 [Candidatus Aenigmarchaeota archaeon]|nr:hypothetical protein [Candidatus Aenigmarchaeota archaeon]
MKVQELMKNQALKKYFLVIVVLAFFVFVGGRMSGYLVAQDAYGTELANLTENYLLLNESYSGCVSDTADLNSALDTLESEKAGISSDLSSANANLESCTSGSAAKDSSISSLTAERDKLANDYGVLSANSAKALCCVKKIFDSTLAAYYIDNNAIVCTADSSKTAFSC